MNNKLFQAPNGGASFGKGSDKSGAGTVLRIPATDYSQHFSELHSMKRRVNLQLLKWLCNNFCGLLQ